ncbi:hypothetical protein EV189_0892 [Motilibacter rhizosphaerae]|uniref:Uncharacterized protein n=1 Tax=Motilibacter rhizosphaerae TaxID=598652 RepID=A0A4Q7NWP7_9ACTN|nr:hypothetical protein [Motilibacter rhizosphaerae]RZS91645.1 hypothetical protein EV189_0892 [Motilibacter rhizosphaerae]
MSLPPRSHPDEVLTMAQKNKDGREAREPEQDRSTKVKGRTPSPTVHVLAHPAKT